MANENKVIYVNDFIEHYCSDCKYFQSNGICHKENPLCTNVRLALQLAAKLPTIDAAEVVRCKDCKHWNIREGNDPSQKYFCGIDGMWCMPARSANDFCSYGERKDNG